MAGQCAKRSEEKAGERISFKLARVYILYIHVRMREEKRSDERRGSYSYCFSVYNAYIHIARKPDARPRLATKIPHQRIAEISTTLVF